MLSDGEVWEHQRRFTYKTLKSLGLGKSAMEEAVVFEAEQLAEDFEKYDTKGDDVLIDGQFNIPVVNVLWSVVAGMRYDYDDPVSSN